MIERRLDDAPGLFDDVLAGEAAGEAGERVVEEPLVGLLALAECRCEVDRDVHVLAVEMRSWRLGLKGERDAVTLAEAEPDQVAAGGRAAAFVEQQARWFPELDDDLGCGGGQGLAGPEVPRHPGPPPRVDLQLGGSERLGRGVLVGTWFVAVADVLPADEVRRIDRAHRREDLRLLVLQEAAFRPDGRLHRAQRDHLQQMILYDVADGADAVVEAAPSFDADGLTHRDLHAAHVVAVPDRLEQSVGEPEHEQIFDTFLAEVVVDSEDLVLREHLVQRCIELAGRVQISTERLFDDDPATLIEPDGCERFDHLRKYVRWDRHVEHGLLGAVVVELFLERVPRSGIGVVALDEIEPLAQRLDDCVIGVGLGRENRLLRVSPEVLVGPRAPRDADDRDREPTVAFKGIERRHQLLLAEVAGGAEQHQRVGRWLRGHHLAPVAPTAVSA